MQQAQNELGRVQNNGEPTLNSYKLPLIPGNRVVALGIPSHQPEMCIPYGVYLQTISCDSTPVKVILLLSKRKLSGLQQSCQP